MDAPLPPSTYLQSVKSTTPLQCNSLASGGGGSEKERKFGSSSPECLPICVPSAADGALVGGAVVVVLRAWHAFLITRESLF